MLTFLTNFLREFLFDESAWQRYMTIGLFGLGTLLVNGGAVPGTGIIVPGDWSAWSGWGAPLVGVALYFAAGVKTPGGAVLRDVLTAKEPPKP